MEAGYELSFHAAAFVWHHRRFTYTTYFRQQLGYGKAEALLLPIHRSRFKGLGGAVWQGQVYTARSPVGSFVYHGYFGYEPFQLIYPDGNRGLSEVCLHALWWFLALLLFICGIFVPACFIPAGLMVFGSLLVARKRAWRARIDPAYDTFRSRVKVAGLVLLQGFLRSGSRLLLGWKEAKWSRGLEVVTTSTVRTVTSGWWKLGSEKAYWSDSGVGRDELLEEISERFADAVVDATGKTDLILSRGPLWNMAIVTATEYHESEGRLTRVRILARPQLALRLALLFVGLGGIPLLAVIFGKLEWLGFYLLIVGGFALWQLFLRPKFALIDRAAEKVDLQELKN
ncbi:MAG: hypothetical protein AAGF67_11255, partial [Verrucomicrobiota bacterium]